MPAFSKKNSDQSKAPLQAAPAREASSDTLWAAKLAHELNNALMAAQSNLDSIRLVCDKFTEAFGLSRQEHFKQHPAGRWASELPILLDDMAATLTFMSGVVNRMRAYSRAAVGVSSRFDVTTAILAALRQARVAFEPSIKIVRKPASGSCIAFGDAAALQQVLVNLFLNAARAIKNSRQPGVLTIKTSRSLRKGVSIAVSDTGAGVLPEIRERLFQPFFTTCREQGGTGLGLFVSREIMQRQNGDLTLDAGTRQGATFIVSLPP